MDVINKIREYIKQSPKIMIYTVIAVICMLLLIFTPEADSSDSENTDFPSPHTEYAKMLERQLKAVISDIEGVGNVTVMVTVEGTVSYNYQQDEYISDDREERETVILSNKDPLIKSIANPKVSGVLVICDGGNSSIIREKVIYAVSTVLDIPTNKVYITR